MSSTGRGRASMIISTLGFVTASIHTGSLAGAKLMIIA
jgi:hypothetical protein